MLLDYFGVDKEKLKSIAGNIFELATDQLDLMLGGYSTGEFGERATEHKLKSMKLFGKEGYILRNLYLPTNNGETTEIDLVFITQNESL